MHFFPSKPLLLPTSLFLLLAISLVSHSSLADHPSQFGRSKRVLINLVEPVEILGELAKFVMEKVGLITAGKRWGPGGRDGFKFGKKLKKLLTSQASSCPKKFGCQVLVDNSTCLPCQGGAGMATCGMYCVYEFGLHDSALYRCYAQCGDPQQTPCTYYRNGTITCSSTTP